MARSRKSEPAKDKGGRPKVDSDLALSIVVKTYVDPSTQSRLEARAKERRLSIAAYLRELIINDQSN